MAGRKKNPNPTKRVDPKIPAEAYTCLLHLAQLGRFGSNTNEVARYLLVRAVDDLTRAGVLPKELGLKPPG